MDGKRNGRVLAAALAVSLALHTVLAAFVHVRFAEAQPYEIPPVITHLIIHPKLTPPPKPHSVAFAHHPIQSVRRPVQPPHVALNPSGVVAIAPPEATGEPIAPGNTGTTGGVIGQPVPVGPLAPACSDPNVEAKTIVAVSPDAPSSAYGTGADVTAMIKVDLDATGRVIGVSVYRSAGSLELDQAALQAARQSTYSPEMRDCQAVHGSYLFKVEFSQ